MQHHATLVLHRPVASHASALPRIQPLVGYVVRTEVALCTARASRHQRPASALLAAPYRRRPSTVVSQSHVGASRQRAAPRSQVVASPQSGLPPFSLEGTAQSIRTAAGSRYARHTMQSVGCVAPRRMLTGPRPNPSLQPTCYGWLRQPSQAAELKR
jgi:hypothetical protein